MSFCNAFVLKVVASHKVKLASSAVKFTFVPETATFCPAAGVNVIPPDDGAEIVFPSILKLSTFSCPVVVCVPVAVIGPVRTMAPVPAGSTTKSPFVSVVIVPSARMFKSPMPTAPLNATVLLNVALNIIMESGDES